MPVTDDMTARRRIRDIDGPGRTAPIAAIRRTLPHQVSAFREAGRIDRIGKRFTREVLLDVAGRHTRTLVRVA